MTDPQQPTSVYRYYDKHGVLLYVGITSRGVTRNIEHNLDKDWWQYVTTQDVDHYGTRPEALRRERELIAKHQPPFNRQHNPSHEAAREAYLGLRPHMDEQVIAVHELYRILGKRLPLVHHDIDGNSLILRTQLAHVDIAANLMRPSWTIRTRDYGGQTVSLRKIERDGQIYYFRFRAERPNVPLLPLASGFFEINCKMQPKDGTSGPRAAFPIKAVRLTADIRRTPLVATR